MYSASSTSGRRTWTQSRSGQHATNTFSVEHIFGGKLTAARASLGRADHPLASGDGRL